MIHILFIAIGGFFGAICRYVFTKFIKGKNKSHFPFGTFLVNIIGSFLLGFLSAFANTKGVMLLLGTGFFGAFTTFSTFNLEAIQLFESKERVTASLYLALTYGGGIIFAFTGFIIGNI